MLPGSGSSTVGQTHYNRLKRLFPLKQCIHELVRRRKCFPFSLHSVTMYAVRCVRTIMRSCYLRPHGPSKRVASGRSLSLAMLLFLTMSAIEQAKCIRSDGSGNLGRRGNWIYDFSAGRISTFLSATPGSIKQSLLVGAKSQAADWSSTGMTCIVSDFLGRFVGPVGENLWTKVALLCHSTQLRVHDRRFAGV